MSYKMRLCKSVLLRSYLPLAKGAVYNCSLELKHSGLYEFNIFTIPSDRCEYYYDNWHTLNIKPSMTLQLELICDSNTVYSKELQCNINQGYLGQEIAILECPKDLQKGETLIGRLTLLHLDDNIPDLFSHAELYVRRIASLRKQSP